MENFRPVTGTPGTLNDSGAFWGPVRDIISGSTLYQRPREVSDSTPGLFNSIAPSGVQPSIESRRPPLAPERVSGQQQHSEGVQSGDSTSGNPTEATNTDSTAPFFLDNRPTIFLDDRHPHLLLPDSTALPRRPTTPTPSTTDTPSPSSPPSTACPVPTAYRTPEPADTPRISPVPTPLEPQPTDSVRTPSSHQPPGPQPSRPLP